MLKDDALNPLNPPPILFCCVTIDVGTALFLLKYVFFFQHYCSDGTSIEQYAIYIYAFFFFCSPPAPWNPKRPKLGVNLLSPT